MAVYKRHFTPEEANAMIPQLRKSMRKIRSTAIALEQAGFDVYKGKYLPGYHPGTKDAFPPEYREMLRLMHRVHDLGIEIKGLRQGLVDFPAIRPNGDEVFLCWKLDEDKIGFWHSLEGGFTGRETMDTF